MAYSDKVRKDAVTKYVILGNVRRVSDETGLDYELLMDWMREDWWRQAEAEVRSGLKNELLGKMHGVVTRAIDILEDRLENGDVVLNNKTGEIIRRPVAARDVQRIATEILGKKIVWEKETERAAIKQETVQEMLGALAKGFLEFNQKMKAKKELVIDNVSDVEYKEV